uniref:Uncharacterized protein n=1 Tax=Mola mola TaxID=94237 RepID=A0A3Q3X5R5_MOLML
VYCCLGGSGRITEQNITVGKTDLILQTKTKMKKKLKSKMDDLGNLPHAMCLLFGLIYALNLEYPQQLKNTFDFIQRVLLSLGHKSLKPKIQSLKNLLISCDWQPVD